MLRPFRHVYAAVIFQPGCIVRILSRRGAAAPDKQIKNERVGPPRLEGDGDGCKENASIIIRFQCGEIFFMRRDALSTSAPYIMLGRAQPRTKDAFSGTNCARRVLNARC